MSSYSCDQFAADALSIRDEIKAETGVDIRFKLPLIEQMVNDIDEATQGRTSVDHDELREAVLGRETFLHDIEHTAYQRLLDRIFHRRLATKSSMNARNGRWAPFAPR